MPLGNTHTLPDRSITPDAHHHRLQPFKQMFMQRLHSIFVRDSSRCRSPSHIDDDEQVTPWPSIPSEALQQKCPPSMKDKERPVTSLPRQATFKRQNSERRERLCPVEPLLQEKRAVSASRHPSQSCVKRRRTKSSPPPTNPARSSAPAAAPSFDYAKAEKPPAEVPTPPIFVEPPIQITHNDSVFDYEERPSRPLSRASSAPGFDEEQHREQLQHELDTRWILNLSMHFRDKSDREKFFVTYAETPTSWRRVTVSCDYRSAEPGSLEMDLRELQFQRDKNMAIYEAIRESLPEIQFYDTVTNLKLETSEGRLHVHVTEDVNEIIPYPSRSMVRHILDDENPAARPMELSEKDIAFDAHLSGFVYRVWHQDKVYIKKEIPSPDTIDEFLYEINALHALHDSEYVINLEAIILDDTRQVVKGLLISYAERGAVVDLLYDFRGRIPWTDRERWARQAVFGLRDIHEEGYVQGDFTLSNVVVDEKGNAQIIDINRRGCPVGWEPPEIAQKIASNQRISMYIGEKSDIYQLGMTLWALAMDDDEPERHDPPLSTDEFPTDVPDWYRNIVRICLAPKPKERLSAKELAKLFPPLAETDITAVNNVDIEPRAHPIARAEPKQYIDPNAAVERDDIERFKKEEQEILYSPQSSKDDWLAFTYPKSSEYDMESAASAAERPRGRTASREDEKELKSLPYTMSDSKDVDGSPQIFEISPDDDQAYDELDLDGKHFLVRRGTFTAEQLDVLNYSQEPPAGCLTTMTLAPTEMTKSPSPFRLPNWQRSLSESTPRNSRTQFFSDSKSEGSDMSPSSTALDLRTRPRTADAIATAHSSSETISAYDGSVGETTISGTTCFTQSSSTNRAYSETKAQTIDNTILESTSAESSIPAEASIRPLRNLLTFQDSGFDEPRLHEIMNTAT